MAQAIGVMGLQGMQVLHSSKQSLSTDVALDRLQHSQDGASCFRQVSLPPIVAISLSTSSSEDLMAGKKGKKKGTLRTRRVVETSSVRDHHQTAARALSVLHERFSTALYHNIALTEDELSRYSIMSPDASTILGQSILEAQWALTLEELMREEKVKEGMVTRKAGKGKSEKKKDSSLEAVGDTCTESTSTAEDTCTESTSDVTTELVVKSGRPSARTRRLEARQRRVAAAGKPTNPEVLMIHPLKKYQKGERAKPVKTEGVQDYLTTYLREITKIDLLTKQEEIVLSKKLRIGLNLIEERKKLAAELGYEPSKEEWAPYMDLSIGELVRKLGEAEWARDKMVMANLRLVVSVAKQYHSYGLEMADLIQEGSIGLLRGVEKFDHTRGFKLSTYVHWWIRQGVTRAIADHSRTVRLPVHVHDTLGRIRKAKSLLLSEGCAASVQEISKATSLTGTKIKNTLQVTKKLVSLDMEIGRNTLQNGDGETLHSLVADRDTENQPWTIVERMLMKEDVDKLLTSQLGPRERDIVRLHYGVGRQDGSVMSLESISHRFLNDVPEEMEVTAFGRLGTNGYGVSRERVRQLETAAMRKLQIKSREQGLDRYLHSI